jgi:hypothetical protein
VSTLTGLLQSDAVRSNEATSAGAECSAGIRLAWGPHALVSRLQRTDVLLSVPRSSDEKVECAADRDLSALAPWRHVHAKDL